MVKNDNFCAVFVQNLRISAFWDLPVFRTNNRGVGIKTGGLENFSKINNRGGTIIRYPRVHLNGFY